MSDITPTETAPAAPRFLDNLCEPRFFELGLPIPGFSSRS